MAQTNGVVIEIIMLARRCGRLMRIVKGSEVRAEMKEFERFNAKWHRQMDLRGLCHLWHVSAGDTFAEGYVKLNANNGRFNTKMYDKYSERMLERS